MKNLSLMLAAILLFAASSCKKQTPNHEETLGPDLTQNVNNIFEMKVPEGFQYKTQKNIPIRISLPQGKANNANCRIQVYDGNPVSNGNLLITGLASSTKPFESSITFPSALDNLYIVITEPNLSSTTTVVSAKGSTIELNALTKNGGALGKAMPSSPDCTTGCTSTVTGNNNVSLNNSGTTICITGNFTGGLDINRGTVKICGNANLSYCNLNNDATLIITNTATVTASNVNLNTANASIRNWSQNVTMSSGFSPNGRVDNYGRISVTGDFNVNGNAVITNEGTLIISGTLNNNKTFTNNGTLSVNGSFNQNGNAALTNNCSFTVAQSATINNPITINGYMGIGQTLTVNSGGVMNIANGAMINTQNLTLNNIIVGTGTPALVKVALNTTINGGGRLNGNLHFCDQNGIETNFGQIAGTVTQGCSLYIPVTACNPAGNGTITIPDTDSDGINDELDEYPNDPELAFNNYYPNAKEMATIAFEDLWPSKGDYDLNDLVVDFRHNMVTNANGEVVLVETDARLRAAGGALKLAFNFEYPFETGLVDKLEGGKLEEKVKFAVVNVFEDSKKELSSWNTVIDQPYANPIEYAISFRLTKPQSLKDLGGVNEFNPFIWINEESKGRGYEVHLPGKNYTELANTEVFGYADDDTQKDQTYLSKTNLPWAILIPEEFIYCQELKPLSTEKEPLDITQVYLKFAQWAQSNGELYKDWYQDKEGYREEKYLYKK